MAEAVSDNPFFEMKISPWDHLRYYMVCRVKLSLKIYAGKLKREDPVENVENHANYTAILAMNL